MAFDDLQSFIAALDVSGELIRIAHPVSVHLELCEIADRVSKIEDVIVSQQRSSTCQHTHFEPLVFKFLQGNHGNASCGCIGDA